MDGHTERYGRRGSLGRAFLRFRDAIRRRSFSNRRTSIVPLTSTTEHPVDTAPTTAALIETEPPEALQSAERTRDSATVPTVLTLVDLPLMPDTEDAIEADTTEPLPPVAPNRTGLTDERARKLFEKYGIKYEPSNTDTQSANDRRRVEKPIRIRIHWTCHDCNSSFGASKTCTNCGHRRCAECPRSPAKRVRQILDTARQLRDEEDQPPAASGDQQTTTDASTAASPPVNNLHTTTAETLQPEGHEHTASISTDHINLAGNQHMIPHCPQSQMKTLLQPKVQVVRRTCAGDPTRSETWIQHFNDEPPTAEKPKTVASVQRVYRKPRMRVRWTCDKCQSIHGDSVGCRQCGHERCAACTRDPPKRIKPPPDPAVLQSVDDKLAHLREPTISVRHIIAAAS